jgi:hypothetical protein
MDAIILSTDIIEANYGIKNKEIDVLDIIKSINVPFFIINNTNMKSDPCPNIIKRLRLRLNNNIDEYKILENNQIMINNKKILDIVNIVIVTTKIIESIAMNFKRILNKIGYQIIIVYDLTEAECIESSENTLYLIICNSLTSKKILPKQFIVFQIEQSTSRYFDHNYLSMLNKSNYIWDFSIKNTNKYSDYVSAAINYMPMPFHLYANDNDTEFDILFYGSTNGRRTRILNTLKTKYNIRISNSCGEERDLMISKCKIVINLHYYTDCALETSRLNEVLAYKKLVISEEPSTNDWYNRYRYRDTVVFFDELNTKDLNTDGLTDLLDYYLDQNNYNNKISQIKNKLVCLEQESEFIVYKNILSVINKNTNIEYDLQNDLIYCMYWPTDCLKIDIRIINDNKFKICPTTNINDLIWNANRCGLDMVTVCKSSFNMPDNFITEYEKIIRYLKTYDNWKIFNGFGTIVPKNTSLQYINSVDSIQYIKLPEIKIQDMTFAIFNLKSIDNKIISAYPNHFTFKKNKNT